MGEGISELRGEIPYLDQHVWIAGNAPMHADTKSHPFVCDEFAPSKKQSKMLSSAAGTMPSCTY